MTSEHARRLLDLLDLGNLARDGGRLDEAAEYYERAIALDPACAPAMNNLGNLKRRQNNADAAVAWLERAAAAAPADATIQNNLAVALQSAGQRDEAIRRYRTALALDPDFASALAGLGTLLAEDGENDEAIRLLGQALDREPGMADLRANLANALAALGRHEDALEHWRRLVAERPDSARYRIKLGGVLRQLGRFEEARQAYAETLTRHPDNAAALAEAVGDKGSTPPAGIEARIAGRLGLPDLPLADRARLRFAMVKIHDARGDDDGAFAELALANEARRRERADKGQVFDAGAIAERFDQIMATFDGARLRGHAGFGDPSPSPVFIVGMPRSGTSLVEQILASHSRVHGAGELGHIGRIASGLRESTGADAPYPFCADRLDARLSRQLAKDYLGHLRRRAPEAERVTDKAPLNFLYLGLIALLLPGARIIHCRRDPIDTCLSCFEQDFQGPMTWAWDLTTLGRYYRQYARLMAHWRRVLPNAFLEMDYETVVDDTRRAAETMVEFCGLDWEERCLDFHRTERAVLTFSLAQVRRPIYATSIGKWRRYRRHLGPLIEALGDLSALP